MLFSPFHSFMERSLFPTGASDFLNTTFSFLPMIFIENILTVKDCCFMGRGVYSSQQVEIFPQPPYFQLEKLPQPEHVKSSVVTAFLSMFKEIYLLFMAFYLSRGSNQVLQM